MRASRISPIFIGLTGAIFFVQSCSRHPKNEGQKTPLISTNEISSSNSTISRSVSPGAEIQRQLPKWMLYSNILHLHEMHSFPDTVESVREMVSKKTNAASFFTESRGTTGDISLDTNDYLFIGNELAQHNDLEPMEYGGVLVRVHTKTDNFIEIIVPGIMGINRYNAYFVKSANGRLLFLKFQRM